MLAVMGCGPSAQSPAPETHSHADSKAGHSHGEWWCAEHGVPEEVCGLCSTKLAAEFQAKGDWCREHDRPDSQCFICHPQYAAKFAAQYEAKYGKQPPQPN
jgi:cobalt-zinc-cadmium efflux system membrane fusion protein